MRSHAARFGIQFGCANTWFYYNNQGLLTNTLTAYGPRQVTVYDNEDRPLWVTDANGVDVTYIVAPK